MLMNPRTYKYIDRHVQLQNVIDHVKDFVISSIHMNVLKSGNMIYILQMMNGVCQVHINNYLQLLR